MLAISYPVLHEALACVTPLHPYPSAAGSIGSHLPSLVLRSHRKEQHSFPLLQRPGREVEAHSGPGCPGFAWPALPATPL
uniref:Uncharacterized protein n=1 Tax=Prolemur simus TaxID=1328070 RepID=A0A8C9A579_PROSS